MSDSPSVKLSPINRYSVAIFLMGITCIMSGVVLYFVAGSDSVTIWIGGLGLVLAGVKLLSGWKHFPNDPPTGGALYCWGVPLMANGRQVVVGGITLLADYFPLKITAVKTDYVNANKEYTIEVVSLDRVTLKGKIALTGTPNPNDIKDFIQAGNSMPGVFTQIQDIVETTAREEAKRHGHLDLIQDGQLIGVPIKVKIESSESGSFGITIFKVNVVLTVPDKVRDALTDVVVETTQRTVEHKEYQTNLLAAQELQGQIMLDKDRDPSVRVPTLMECLEIVLQQRLIRDGKATSFRIPGGGTAIPVVPTTTPPTT